MVLRGLPSERARARLRVSVGVGDDLGRRCAWLAWPRRQPSVEERSVRSEPCDSICRRWGENVAFKVLVSVLSFSDMTGL